MKAYIPPTMSSSKQRRVKNNSEHRVRDASEMANAIAEHPGVADLLKLYEQHAQMVQRANAYLTPRNRIIIFASSDTTA